MTVAYHCIIVLNTSLVSNSGFTFWGFHSLGSSWWRSVLVPGKSQSRLSSSCVRTSSLHLPGAGALLNTTSHLCRLVAVRPWRRWRRSVLRGPPLICSVRKSKKVWLLYFRRRTSTLLLSLSTSSLYWYFRASNFEKTRYTQSPQYLVFWTSMQSNALWTFFTCFNTHSDLLL